MKVAIVIDAFTRGGAQIAMLELAREFKKRSHHVDLILMMNSRLEIVDVQDSFIGIYRVNAMHLFDIKGLFRFFRILRRENYEVVIANLYFSQLWCGLIKWFARNMRLVWVEHNVYHNRSAFQWWLVRYFGRRFDEFVAVSAEVRDFLRVRAGLDSIVIPNAIHDRIERVRVPHEGLNVLFVGRLIEQKRPNLALSSFEEAFRRGSISNESMLSFVGEGPLEISLRKQSRDLGIEHRVKFLGYRVPETMGEIYASHHCLLTTSIVEGQPLNRLEALHQGLCVVTTETPGLAEILSMIVKIDRSNGVFVVRPDVNEIAEALRQAQEVSCWSEEKISKRKHLVRNCLPNQVGDRYEELILELESKGKTR